MLIHYAHIMITHLIFSKPRFLWARLVLHMLQHRTHTHIGSLSSYPYLFGAMQMIENNSTLADRVIPALHKFVTLANTMLKNDDGLEDWTRTRWEDFVIALQW